MSPFVFSLTVCGVLLAFCRWGPWTPPRVALPHLWPHLRLERGLEPSSVLSGQSVGEAVLGALGPLRPTTPLEDDSPLCVEHGLACLIGGSGGEGHNRGAN